MSHTPGPWIVDIHEHYSGKHTARIERVDGTRIALVHYGEKNRTERLANAALIAYAPTLSVRIQELEGLLGLQLHQIDDQDDDAYVWARDPKTGELKQFFPRDLPETFKALRAASLTVEERDAS